MTPPNENELIWTLSEGVCLAKGISFNYEIRAKSDGVSLRINNNTLSIFSDENCIEHAERTANLHHTALLKIYVDAQKEVYEMFKEKK